MGAALSSRFTLFARSCPNCGSNDESHVYAEADFDFSKSDAFTFSSRKLPEFMHFRMISCLTCELLYASPIPSPEDLSAAYREASFDSGHEASRASHTYGAYLSGVLKKLRSRSGALDIGTGDGAFLKILLAQGFSGVVGIEPSEAPVAQASPEIRPLIVNSVFDSNMFEAASFDLVTCFQTMEHVPNPRSLVEGVSRLLRPGGAFFFVAHNHRAVSARLLGTRSPIFDIEHMQLFSPKSAAYLLTSCGFRDVSCRIMVNSYPLLYWIKLMPLPKWFKTGVMTVLKWSRIGMIPVAIPAGNIAVVGYKS